MNLISPFRVGTVQAQDAANARVRVTFADYDQMRSYWLPVMVAKTQDDKAYWLPDVGELVVCLMDRNDEDGAVLGSIYSTVDQPPIGSPDKWHLTFKDGAAFEYDRSSHVLSLAFQDGAALSYDAGAHLLTVEFSDSTAIKYDAAQHAFSLAGGPAASAIVVAPAGIVLQSGGSQVTINPGGVAITPPLPISSTVAQT
jgi:phage baseplate assembly protein gpV